MRKLILILSLSLAIALWLWEQKPTCVSTRTAEVLALQDVEGSRGLRRIHVKMPGGQMMWVETYVPFFFRVGDPINIAEYSHILRGTTFDVIAN